MAYDWNALVARVVAQMQTITDIGNVFDRVRLVTKKQPLSAVVTATIGGQKKVRVWMVSAESADPERADSSGRLQWGDQILIEGFLQLEDGVDSMATALSLAQQIIRVLNTDTVSTRLNGTVLTAKPPQLVANELRGYLGIATHYLKLRMPVTGLD